MKKIKLLCVVLSLIIILTACGETITMVYPAGFFKSGEERQTTADSLRNTDGMKDVILGDDGSLTLKMSPERYENIKNAATATVVSIPVYCIGDNTAVRGFESDEAFTNLSITVNKNAEGAEEECDFIVYMVRMYHVCMLDYDKVINVNYIDNESGEIYDTISYNINGDIVSKELPTE